MRKEEEQLFKRLNERFVRAFVTYKLLEDDDHILVGLSGGKDSLLLTELLAKRARIDQPRFRVEAIHVRMENVRYETSTDYLQQFCDNLNVPLHIVTTSFDDNDISNSPSPTSHSSSLTSHSSSPSSHSKPKPACFLCSWYRRKQLFNLAQELGCNKIALGHHRDDIIHTALMNLTFQGRFDAMPARLKMRKMPLSIIRPLCLIDEEDISRYAELSHYEKQVKLCPHEHETNRTAIAEVYQSMQRINPEARFSLWRAIETAGKLTEDY